MANELLLRTPYHSVQYEELINSSKGLLHCLKTMLIIVGSLAIVFDIRVIRKVTLDLKNQQRILLYYTLICSLQIVRRCGRSWRFIIT